MISQAGPLVASCPPPTICPVKAESSVQLPLLGNRHPLNLTISPSTTFEPAPPVATSVQSLTLKLFEQDLPP